MFMPPNVTALIQPMDQNAIRITKLHYRNSLLATIIAKEGDLLESMKKITLKEGVSILEASWNRVGKETLSNCWKNILNMVNDEDDPKFNVPLSVLKEKWQSEVRSLENIAADLLQTLRLQEVFTAVNIRDWINNPCEDVTPFDENYLNEESDDDDDCFIEAPENNIKAKEAVEILNKAVQWAEFQTVDQTDIKVLKKIRELPVNKLVEQKKKQKIITDYFHI
ncbi:jerky protein homolog-like [Lucilia sericata]|uniref:jerky protein homolog-like n=1 Tax=Lucilia sericata TaxID=13632 RepID=UPI0018A84E5A|nr:jerky protein homolog-like [Lucilia sericata]